MKRYVCPQCGTSAPVRHYADEAKHGKLRCFDCSTPGKPVYIEVVEDKKAKKSA